MRYAVFPSFCFLSDASECPRGKILSGTNGSLTTPRFPVRYPNSVKCTWIIQVPEGFQVRLRFDSFRLETCTLPSVCSCDHVQVRDGRDESSQSLAKLCGDHSPTILRSSGQTLWVEFESDSLTGGQGFSATFKAVRKYTMYILYYTMYTMLTYAKSYLTLK